LDLDRLFFETNSRVLYDFDYNQSDGTVAERQTFADLRDTPGKPDGLTVERLGLSHSK
jgi:sugar lactone lactonase YvrE